MPELPEVESARLQLQKVARGKRISAVSVKPDPLVFRADSPAELSRTLRGRRVVGTGRRGKHFWAVLDKTPWPFFHFGMSGSLHVYRRMADRPKHWKMEWVLDDGTRVAWNDPRRFGRIRLMEDPAIHPTLSKLGSDVLIDLPSLSNFRTLLRARKRNIKAILLDQTYFAGVGNWIADEVLYQAAISPHRMTTELSDAEVKTLRHQLKSVVRKAVSVNADSDRFPKRWLFHHRWSARLRELPSGESMIRETIAGRTTAWIPQVQR